MTNIDSLRELLKHACPADTLYLDDEWRLFVLDLHCIDAVILCSRHTWVNQREPRPQHEVVEVQYVEQGYAWRLQSNGDYMKPTIVQGKPHQSCDACGGAL